MSNFANTLDYVARSQSNNWSLDSIKNSGLLGQQPTSSRPGGALWNTNLDAQVGNIDKQISEFNGVAQLGSNQGTPQQQADLANLTKERNYYNAQRWQSVNWSQVPGGMGDRITGLVNSGQLSWDDLAGMDISLLNDPAKLSDTVNGILAQKAAPAGPAAQTPTTASPATSTPASTAQQNAQSATNNVLPAVEQYAQAALDPNNPNSALGKFDATVSQNQAEIGSTATRAARALGGEAAGFEAGQSQANLQANAAAGRDTVQKNTMADVQSFVDSQIESAVNEGKDLSSLDAASRMSIQENGLNSLTQELSKAMQGQGATAQANMQAVQASINDWQAALKRGEEGANERTAVVKGILGLLGGIAARAAA